MRARARVDDTAVGLLQEVATRLAMDNANQRGGDSTQHGSVRESPPPSLENEKNKSNHSNETAHAHEETKGADDGTLDAGDRIATGESCEEVKMSDEMGDYMGTAS